MRSVSLLLLGAAVASCTTAPPAPRSASAEAHLESLLAGKVAGAPADCIPSSAADNMIVIDDNTLLFREGSRRVWRNDLEGGSCYGLSMGGALVTKRGVGTSSLCRGDVSHVMSSSGLITSSCILGDFIPYTTAGR
jgi:hypothetical protein